MLSAQIDGDILLRYRMEKRAVVTGILGMNDPLISTYDVMREGIGHDLAGLFARDSTILKTEIDAVLSALLAPETP